jgi:polyisoprenoid-binding protein YceI
MRSALLAALVFTGSIALADPMLTVDPAQSTLTYHLVHKLHKVAGVSHRVEGKALLLAGGKAQVMVRVPVQSFDSGNVNRDEHMKETVEAARFPLVELKALAEGLTAPAKFPTTVRTPFKVQLQFHGQSQVFEVPVELTWLAADRVRADASFDISLDAYKVERPSLMFMKVNDALGIEAHLVFKK